MTRYRAKCYIFPVFFAGPTPQVGDLVAMDSDEWQKVFRDVAREARTSNDMAALVRAQLLAYPV